MSPASFAQHPIRAPADVEGHVLLASETRPGDWTDWLEAAGLSHLEGRPRRKLMGSRSSHLSQPSIGTA
jgi:LysR family transcriptional regulator, glycine cleavage system transcriptional activator